MPHSVASSLCGLLVTSILLLFVNILGIFQRSLQVNFHHKPLLTLIANALFPFWH